MIGLSFGFHDAAISAIRGDQIVYGSHTERHTRVKNYEWLHYHQIRETLDYIDWSDETVVYYEKPWKKALRQYMHGHPRPTHKVRDHIDVMFGVATDGYSQSFTPRIKTVGHHESHAAAGFYTSPWTEAAIIVVDAIGEFDCMSIWVGRGRSLKKVWSRRYPHSLGLLYSAFTQRMGLKPNEHEYIMMGMAPYGKAFPSGAAIFQDFIDGNTVDSAIEGFRLKRNVHKGIGNYRPEISNEDLAAGIQLITRGILLALFKFAHRITGMKNVCYQGGVALNCSANTHIIRNAPFDDYWIMPNPGDAGASLGAALAYNRDFVEWKTPFLGTPISMTDPNAVVLELLTEGVAGVASDRAEFGPRAFGNRSLLADPRVPTMQNRVNDIKKREKFRPFAPAILSEHVDDYFITFGADTRYMQYALPCKKQDSIPAVVHVDGTSRVQSVGKDGSVLRMILEKWYQETGCPVLLNTSLNIKGEPLVNNMMDAEDFANRYGVKVF